MCLLKHMGCFHAASIQCSVCAVHAFWCVENCVQLTSDIYVSWNCDVAGKRKRKGKGARVQMQQVEEESDVEEFTKKKSKKDKSPEKGKKERKKDRHGGFVSSM